MGKRTNDGVFITQETKRGLGVTCPRPDCGGKFIVQGDKWMQDKEFKSRPCPYCWRISFLPGVLHPDDQ